MAFIDWLWLVKLIMEILKLIAALPQDELDAIAKLRTVLEVPDPPGKQNTRSRTKPT